MTEIKKLVLDSLSKSLETDVTINEKNFFLVNGVRSRLTWNPNLEKDLENPSFLKEFIDLYCEMLLLERKYFLEKKIYK